ncbi:MAG: choline-sulfatase [Alphaproteobacteria bacterium]|nr:MAG: choline-sulfatase [Alphaproteobacteria bacterium]
MAQKQPNILVIMFDQMAPQFLGCYGHPLVKSPHIDALAENGVLFENAYTNFPLCVPSRASFMAGRYANAMEVWDNATDFSCATPTIAHYLRAQGYTATLCGKMHFIGPDQLHGFQQRLVTDVYPSNFAWTPDWTEGPRNRPTGINMRAVIDSGTCIRSLQIDYDDEVEFFALQKIYDLVRFSENQPFFLMVSFTHPHSPFIAKRDYWERYDHEAIDMPRVGPIPLEEQDEMSRWLHFAHGGDLDEVREEHVRNARHAYYGMISYCDDKVGRLMATLDEVGLADDTVTIFTADHGEMLGERGAWYKQYFYENSARVPLIVHCPSRYGSAQVSANVSLADILPTAMDLATDGGQWREIEPLHGNSLAGFLDGDGGDWDNIVISEYTGEGTCAPCRMIRRDNYKLIYTHGFPDLLYDLERDPDELTNLAEDPAHSETRDELKAILLTGWNPAVINEKTLQSQRNRRFIQDTTGGEPTWAFKLRPDDDRRYVRNSGAVQTKAKARYPFIAPPPIGR